MGRGILITRSMIEVEKSFTVAQKRFIEFLQKNGKASATIVAYNKDLEQLIAYLVKEKRLTQVNSVFPEHIEEFKKSLEKKAFSPKTISRKLNSAKTFFRWLKSENIISFDPAASVSHPKYQTNPPRVLSPMEYRALRDVARND